MAATLFDQIHTLTFYKQFVFLFIVGICFTSCKDKAQVSKKIASFNSFEISYTDGWINHFSFLLDSNKIYFSNHKFDTTFYGLIPDKTFNLIDSCVSIILKDTTIKSNVDKCDDCSVVSVKIVKNNDTTNIIQYGDLSKIFRILVKEIQLFIDRSKHKKLQALISFDTRADINPIPPILKEGNNLKPSK